MMSGSEPPPPTTHYESGADLPAVPVSQSPVEKFREFLEVRGLKCTGERLRIVEHIFEEHNHFDADQLVASMRLKRANVSRSTVYRTLTLLVEAGLLRELQLGTRKAYEHDYGYPHHEHFYCERCGKVIEFVSEELSQLQEEICRRFRFRAKTHTFIIHGICSDCAGSKRSGQRLEMI